MKKNFKFFRFLSILIVLFFLVWFNLPLEYRYYKKARVGNQFAENVQYYQKQFGKLPETNERLIWEKLRPTPPNGYDIWEYRKISAQHFEVMLVKGFDPPYLRFRTDKNEWVHY